MEVLSGSGIMEASAYALYSYAFHIKRNPVAARGRNGIVCIDYILLSKFSDTHIYPFLSQ